MWRSLFVAGLIAVGISAWIISGQMGDNPVAPEVKKPPVNLERAQRLQTVRTAVYQAEPFEQQVVMAGTTAADRKTTVSAEIGGRIAEVKVAQGDRVDAGQLLAVIETETRELSLVQAQAAFDQAQADYDSASKLAQRGFVSQNRVSQTRAALRAAEANLAAARQSLANLTVSAPVAGVVLSLPVEVGSLASPGAPVAIIASVDPLLIVVEASEQDIGALQLGERAQAVTASGLALEGEVSFIDAIANPNTRTFRVEVRAPNPSDRLLEGMSAEVRFFRPARQAHLIPATLLSLGPDGEVGLKYLAADDTVAFLAADLVNATPEGVWLEGLPDRVTVITVGQEFVKVGDRVNAVDAKTLQGGGKAADTSDETSNQGKGS